MNPIQHVFAFLANPVQTTYETLDPKIVEQGDDYIIQSGVSSRTVGKITEGTTIPGDRTIVHTHIGKHLWLTRVIGK